MKKLLIALIALAPLSVMAANASLGEGCKPDGSIAHSGDGMPLSCAGGKFVRSFDPPHSASDEPELVKQLVQLNTTQLKILEVLTNKVYSEATTSTLSVPNETNLNTTTTSTDN